MASSRNSLLCSGLFVAVSVLFCGTFASNTVPCPIGWVPYQKTVPYTCLYVSDSTTDTLMQAHQRCVGKNASLIVIQSEQKMQFFKDIIRQYLSSSTKIWIGLQKDSYRVTWLTKDGKIPADPQRPSGMQFTDWSYRYSSTYNTKGLIYYSNSLHRYDNVRYNQASRFICERRTMCTKGWYGLGCDKQCHCYGQECNTEALEMTCDYGCQVGWMGKACNQSKEDADVRYFCVNSPDQGKFAHIRIDTKGVNYENIHALDNASHTISWCNNTIVQTDQLLSVVTIKIYVDNSTDQAIEEGNCVGKIGEHGKYEWKIKIQEMGGIVSRNDKEVLVECDFSGADTFQLSGDIEIKRESWFRRSDIKKAVEFLQEKKEKVELLVVDPLTGNKVTETHIGSPVVLRINFGVGGGNIATGVNPYNCYASSSDGEQKTMFIDDMGCPLERFPIAEFSRNGTAKSLITKPFPLFGFDGTEGVEFHCSYTLCFDDGPCLANCDEALSDQGQNVTHTRMRRSAGNRRQTIKGTIEVISEWQ